MKMLTKTIILAIASIVLISGCAGLYGSGRVKSSVVDYLYPKNSGIVIKPSIPHLNIPIKVGIAFVPDQPSNSRSSRNRMLHLTEANKHDLLEKVAAKFRNYIFVSEIEVIPTAYLTPKGGFSNLDQIKTMYGIDVIALVSYDQAQFTDSSVLSLSYWTLIGAYLVSGEKNDTSTMIDTAVYDIASKKMLFRAPGTSVVKGRSTPINLSEELRVDSLTSFNQAAEKMTENLVVQLDRFRAKIKKNPKKVKITYEQGYSGGGVFGLSDLLTLLLLGFIILAVKSIRQRQMRRVRVKIKSRR